MEHGSVLVVQLFCFVAENAAFFPSLSSFSVAWTGIPPVNPRSGRDDQELYRCLFSSLERHIFASLVKRRVSFSQSEDKAFGSIPPPEKSTHLQESIFATFSLDPRKWVFTNRPQGWEVSTHPAALLRNDTAFHQNRELVSMSGSMYVTASEYYRMGHER